MNKPEPGYYYHYKHDPEKEWNDHCYYVMGTTWHTEDHSKAVVYLPLYGDTEFLDGADFSLRPLEMFMDENVEWEGKIYPKRFTKIEDPEFIEKLEIERKKLYGE